eukprot:scaffold3587_cov364-Prasinococcus_capsulatus_cf.AAC.3
MSKTSLSGNPFYSPIPMIIAATTRRVPQRAGDGAVSSQQVHIPLLRRLLEITLRLWKARLDPRAHRKPNHVKESSETVARMTPITTGASDSTIRGVGRYPKMTTESRTVKNGSRALIVCVNETATELKLRFVSANPAACSAARGATRRSSFDDSFGRWMTLKAISAAPTAALTPRWTAVHVNGYGNTLNTCLLYKLKAMLQAYHVRNSPPSFTALAMSGARLRRLSSVRFKYPFVSSFITFIQQPMTLP